MLFRSTSEEDDSQYELPQPKSTQNEDANLDIDKETQDTVDFINQMIQKQEQNQNNEEKQYIQVTAPVEEKKEESKNNTKILQSKNKEILYDPSKPFNQQQPRKITNQKRISEEIKEENLQITETEPTLSLEKEEVKEVINQEPPLIKGNSEGRLSRFKDKPNDLEVVEDENIENNDIELEMEPIEEVAIKGKKAKKGKKEKPKKTNKEKATKKEGRKKTKGSKNKESETYNL